LNKLDLSEPQLKWKVCIKKFQINQKYFKLGFHVYLKYFVEMNRGSFGPCKNMSLRDPVLHVKYVLSVVLSCCQDKWLLPVTCLHISLTKSFLFCFIVLISTEHLSQSGVHGSALHFQTKKKEEHML